MQTIDEAKSHCRYGGKGDEKMVADGVDFAMNVEKVFES